MTGSPTTAELAAAIGGRLEGESRPVERLAPPEAPERGTIVVAADADAAVEAARRGVAALVLPEGMELPEAAAGTPVIRVEDPRLALARLSRAFDARPRPEPGVHPLAWVHPDARVAPDAAIGPGCSVGADCEVGAGSVLHANVVLYDGVTLGARVTLHAGAVIGADGFGYAAGPRGAEKIHHLGGVVLEDDVEIGANSAVDRGTLSPTVIGARTKIDNLCQIGHNVRIGPDCLIAGMSAIGGSTRLGRGVVMGGLAGIRDHVEIGDGARIAARAGVTKDVPAGETWAGFPAQPYRGWARSLYLLGQLERMWRALKDREQAGREDEDEV